METITFISLSVGTLLFWVIVYYLLKNPHRKTKQTTFKTV